MKLNNDKKHQMYQLPSISDNLMSNIKLEEVMVPIKKLTRKKLIKLLIKSIKRVNKSTKKLNKSDDKSKELKPSKAEPLIRQPYQVKTRKQDHGVNKQALAKTYLSPNHLDYLDASKMFKDKGDFSETNLPSIKKKFMQRKEDEYRNRLKFVSQSYNPDALDSHNQELFLKSIDHQMNPSSFKMIHTDLQMPHEFNTHLLNTEYSLINNLNHLQSSNHLLNVQTHYNPNDLKAINLDKHSNAFFARNEEEAPDQIIRIHIPMNELTHYPIFVKDQLNSTNTQSFIRNFVESQLDRKTSRSDNGKQLTSKLLTFLAKQLDIETDQSDKKAQELALQSGITKVLGNLAL